METCIFCNADLSGNRAKEHVIPAWMLDYLGIRDMEITPNHTSITDESGKPVDSEVRSIREHTLNGLLAGHVCKKCNHGWMSELEGAVMPIIKPLIEGTKDIRKGSHSDSERLILARWVAKTAYVLNDSSNYPKIVPRSHIQSLFERPDTLPSLVVVVYGYNPESVPLNWVQQSSWHATSTTVSESEFVEAAKKSYKIAFQFGHAMLMVAFWEDDRLLYALEKGMHVPIWPVAGKVMWSQTSTTETERTATEEFFYFATSFGVAEESMDGETSTGPVKITHFRFDETRR